MKIAFDSNIIISHKVRIFPRNHYLASIVLAEMLAGAPDKEVIKFWRVAQTFAVNIGQLIVPDAEDWLQAGLALQRLSNFGSTPKFSPEERQRLFNDCLLAASCRRAAVTVITDNLKDLERISAVCRVKWLPGNQFFNPTTE